MRQHTCRLGSNAILVFEVVDGGYQPTKTESEEDVSIDATQEEAFRVMLANDPRW